MSVLMVLWGLLKIFLGLLVVVGLAYLATRVLSQGVGASPQRGPVRVLGHLHLGGRRGVSLVKLGSRVLVLGVTDHEVRLLSDVTDPAEVAALEQAAPTPLAVPAQWGKVRDFSRILAARLADEEGGRPGGRGREALRRLARRLEGKGGKGDGR